MLATADYQSILDLVQELYACESPLALCRYATQQLARLIPCEVASFNAFDPNGLTVVATDEPEGICTEQLRAILATQPQGHPLIAMLMQLHEPTVFGSRTSSVGIGSDRHPSRATSTGQSG